MRMKGRKGVKKMRTLLEFVNWVYGDTYAMYYKTNEKKGTEKMKEAKFKVGDKVIIKDGSKIKDYRGGWIKAMKDEVGKVCTISFVANPTEFYDSFGYRMKEIDFTWDERGLELADGTIIISIEGNKVTANYNGRRGIARCNTEDDFELKTGVAIAIDRLFADMDRIKEDDWVEVVDPGYSYTTLPEWVADNIKDKRKIAEYRYGQAPERFMEGTVLKIAKHPSFDDDLAYFEGYNGCYVIGIKGLKKVKK